MLGSELVAAETGSDFEIFVKPEKLGFLKIFEILVGLIKFSKILGILIFCLFDFAELQVFRIVRVVWLKNSAEQI